MLQGFWHCTATLKADKFTSEVFFHPPSCKSLGFSNDVTLFVRNVNSFRNTPMGRPVWFVDPNCASVKLQCIPERFGYVHEDLDKFVDWDALFSAQVGGAVLPDAHPRLWLPTCPIFLVGVLACECCYQPLSLDDVLLTFLTNGIYELAPGVSLPCDLAPADSQYLSGVISEEAVDFPCQTATLNLQFLTCKTGPKQCPRANRSSKFFNTSPCTCRSSVTMCTSSYAAHNMSFRVVKDKKLEKMQS